MKLDEEINIEMIFIYAQTNVQNFIYIYFYSAMVEMSNCSKNNHFYFALNSFTVHSRKVWVKFSPTTGYFEEYPDVISPQGLFNDAMFTYSHYLSFYFMIICRGSSIKYQDIPYTLLHKIYIPRYFAKIIDIKNYTSPGYTIYTPT